MSFLSCWWKIYHFLFLWLRGGGGGGGGVPRNKNSSLSLSSSTSSQCMDLSIYKHQISNVFPSCSRRVSLSLYIQRLLFTSNKQYIYTHIHTHTQTKTYTYHKATIFKHHISNLLFFFQILLHAYFIYNTYYIQATSIIQQYTLNPISTVMHF